MKLKKTSSALLGFLVLAASAAQAQYTYTTNADGVSITITGYTGALLGGAVTIPTNINNLLVTSIGMSAFKNANLTSVTIPNSVTSIGENAFGYCASLTAIAVNPNNSFYCDVDGVLFNQSRTTLVQYPAGLVGSYTIPDSVNTIGEYALDGCSGLTNLTIPDSVANIGEYAFYGCGLTSAIIPGSVTSLGDDAFLYCTGLTIVTIGNGATSIGANTFYGCASLTSCHDRRRRHRHRGICVL